MPTYSPLTGKAAASVALATRRLNIWEGAVRSAKTVSSVIAWLKFVRSAPRDGELVMIGKTERTLKRNVLTIITGMLGNRRVRHIEGSGELWILDRRIWLVGANDAKAEGKIRGMTLVGAYVDEASLMPEVMWRMLGTRLSVPGARLFATTNPDNPRHWLKGVLDRADVWVTPDGSLSTTTDRGGAGAAGGEEAQQSERLDLARFSFTLHDNPHLNPEYIRALEAEYAGLWRRRFILGEWCIAEGAIYPMWDPAVHVVPAHRLPEPEQLVACGMDYGTRHPFAAVLLARAQGKLWAVDEWVWDSGLTKTQLTSHQYSARVREWLGERLPAVSGVYVDPAAADFRRALWVDGMTGVQLADNDVAPGIRTVSSLLGQRRLLISSSCSRLIDGLPGYAWDERAAVLGEDKPIKEADDEADALRYAVHSSRWVWESQLRAA